MIRRPPRSALDRSSAASDVYKRQGHAEAILQAIAPTGRLLGLDADPAAVARARMRLAPFGERAILAQANFDPMRIVAGAYRLGPAAVLRGLGL